MWSNIVASDMYHENITPLTLQLADFLILISTVSKIVLKHQASWWLFSYSYDRSLIDKKARKQTWALLNNMPRETYLCRARTQNSDKSGWRPTSQATRYRDACTTCNSVLYEHDAPKMEPHNASPPCINHTPYSKIRISNNRKCLRSRILLVPA